MTTTTTTCTIGSMTTKKRVTIFLNPSIDKHARAQAIIEDLTLSQFIEKALINYLPPKTIILKPKINVIKK